MKTDLMPLRFPANLSGYYNDTSHGRSPPGKGGYKTGIVREFCLRKADNTGVFRPLLLHSCRQPPDVWLRHHRLKFHTLGSSSSSSQKHNGREEFCRPLFHKAERKNILDGNKNPPTKTTVGPTQTISPATHRQLQQLCPHQTTSCVGVGSSTSCGFVKVHRVSFTVEIYKPTISQVSPGFSGSTTHLLSYTNNKKKWPSKRCRVNMSQNRGMWPEAPKVTLLLDKLNQVTICKR